MAAKNGDKPLGNIKRIPIETEVNHDPAKYPLKDGTLVLFPDVYDLPVEEAEQFLDEASEAQYTGKVTPVLKKWLSEEHYKALVAEYKSLRQLGAVLQSVMAYYEGVWGNQGEGNASEA